MSTPPAAPTPPADYSPGLQRLAALSGLVFATLIVVTIAVTSAETPDIDEPLSEWAQYARDNDGKLRIGALLVGVASFEFLWFLGLVRGALGDAETAARGYTRLAYIVLASGIVGIVGLLLGLTLSAAAAQHVDELGPAFVRGLSEFSGAAFIPASVGFGTMLYTTAFVVLRFGGLPRWLGWLSLAGGLCFLLQLGVLLSEDFDNAFGIFYPLGFLSLVIWSAGASVALMQRVGRPPA